LFEKDTYLTIMGVCPAAVSLAFLECKYNDTNYNISVSFDLDSNI
jgi:hypothetical protein